MTDQSVIDAALAEFPEIQRLITLKESGRHDSPWLFSPAVLDGDLAGVQAARGWPNGWADALRVLYVTDAMAVRCAPDGGVTWRCEGTLTDVVDALLDLPEPQDGTGPCLVIGRAPHLWTPSTARR